MTLCKAPSSEGKFQSDKEGAHWRLMLDPHDLALQAVLCAQLRLGVGAASCGVPPTTNLLLPKRLT